MTDRFWVNALAPSAMLLLVFLFRNIVGYVPSRAVLKENLLTLPLDIALVSSSVVIASMVDHGRVIVAVAGTLAYISFLAVLFAFYQYSLRLWNTRTMRGKALKLAMRSIVIAGSVFIGFSVLMELR